MRTFYTSAVLSLALLANSSAFAEGDEGRGVPPISQKGTIEVIGFAERVSVTITDQPFYHTAPAKALYTMMLANVGKGVSKAEPTVTQGSVEHGEKTSTTIWTKTVLTGKDLNCTRTDIQSTVEDEKQDDETVYSCQTMILSNGLINSTGIDPEQQK